jgi:hypothetical protein
VSRLCTIPNATRVEIAHGMDEWHDIGTAMVDVTGAKAIYADGEHVIVLLAVRAFRFTLPTEEEATEAVRLLARVAR